MGLTVVVHDAGLHDKPKPGDLIVRRATITFDNSYPTGGEAVTASAFDLHQVVGIKQIGAALKTWWTFYLTTGYLVAVVLGTGAEVANTTDLSTLVIEAEVSGY